jgi:hypothetical protein
LAHCDRRHRPQFRGTLILDYQVLVPRGELIDELDVARLPVLVESRFQRTMALADFCVILVRF